MALSDKQIGFVDAFCSHWNGAKAARDVGYAESNARQQAYKNLQNPEIVAEIRARQEAAHLDAVNVLHLLQRQATVDLSDLYDVANDGQPVLNLQRAEANGALQLVDRFVRDRDGRVVDVVLLDRQAALLTVVKHFRLISDRIDLLEHADKLSPADQRAVAEKLLGSMTPAAAAQITHCPPATSLSPTRPQGVVSTSTTGRAQRGSSPTSPTDKDSVMTTITHALNPWQVSSLPPTDPAALFTSYRAGGLCVAPGADRSHFKTLRTAPVLAVEFHDRGATLDYVVDELGDWPTM